MLITGFIFVGLIMGLFTYLCIMSFRQSGRMSEEERREWGEH